MLLQCDCPPSLVLQASPDSLPPPHPTPRTGFPPTCTPGAEGFFECLCHYPCSFSLYLVIFLSFAEGVSSREAPPPKPLALPIPASPQGDPWGLGTQHLHRLHSLMTKEAPSSQRMLPLVLHLVDMQAWSREGSVSSGGISYI